MTLEGVDAALVQQMIGMSEADLSVLRSALNRLTPIQGSGGFGKKQQEVSLATTEDSANDRLWSEFVTRGWLAEGQVPVELSKTQTKIFTLLSQGREPISQLLTARDTANRTHSSAMTKIYDEKCQPFLDELVAAVRAAGGGGKDVSIILGVLLMRTAQRIGAEGKHDVVLDDILRIAHDSLRRESAVKPD